MKQSGQMLIEIIVSIGILALVLVGVSDLMTRTQRVSSFQAKKEDANAIAREILNDYRRQRDLNPTSFESSVVGLSREVCVEGKSFSCSSVVDIEDASVTVNVTVRWVEGDNTFSVNLKQKLNEIQ